MLAKGGGGLSKPGLSSRHTTLVSPRRAGSGAGSAARLRAPAVEQEPDPALGAWRVWEPRGESCRLQPLVLALEPGPGQGHPLVPECSHGSCGRPGSRTVLAADVAPFQSLPAS